MQTSTHSRLENWAYLRENPLNEKISIVRFSFQIKIELLKSHRKHNHNKNSTNITFQNNPRNLLDVVFTMKYNH